MNLRKKSGLKGTNFETPNGVEKATLHAKFSKIGLKKYSYGFIALNGINFLLVVAFCSLLAVKLGYISLNQALLTVLAYLALFYLLMHRFAGKMLNSYIAEGKV